MKTAVGTGFQPRREGHVNVVGLLLENKADVNHAFDEGGAGRRLTAHDLAERAGHTKADQSIYIGNKS